MAHLQYALSGMGGLICLTGEVGTGKTTLCRSFLASLTDDVKTAYIFNPQLSSVELLQSVCDDFGITYGNSDSLRDLYRYLNEFLIAQYSEAHKVLCVIDEAQAMSADLLEQVRLLTNLETHSEKLMTVILVGQPELQDTLSRHDLRQLNQRITARYHLKHLSQNETCEYINFRLERSGGEEGLFSDSAMKRLWTASRGIPRLINVLCDRALLGAYAQEEHKVSMALVKGAELEIMPAQAQAIAKKVRHQRQNRLLTVMMTLTVMVGVISLLGSVAVVWQPDLIKNLFSSTQNPVAMLSRQMIGEEVNNCDALEQTGYKCLWVDWPLTKLNNRNKNLLLQVKTVNGDIHWQANRPQSPDVYNGHALLFWQPPAGYDEDQLIKPGERSEVVNWVRQKLGGSWSNEWQVFSPNGRTVSADSDYYDPLLANKVEQFQRLNGLLSDRILGPQTLYYLQLAGE